MYHYVTDKEYLKQTYSICADIVNQLVQNLKRYNIDAKMTNVGSKKRGLITQNENEPIDYDFNLNILNWSCFSPRDLKEQVIEAFNEVLETNGWENCQDSTSAITTAQRVLKKGNRTPFSIDIGIVKYDSFGVHRLIHEKTGFVAFDQYKWNQVPNSEKIIQMEEYLKPDCWPLVRKAYLDKKNMYLTRNDYSHPSFVCYIEALHEIYNQIRRRNGYWY